MQITYNPTEVRNIVLEHVQSSLNLDDSNDFMIEILEDGSVAVGVNEAVEGQRSTEGSSTSQNEGRQRKPRRTKAQIAEDERLAAEQAEADKQTATSPNPAAASQSTQTTSAASVKPSDPASPEDAGETIQTQETSHGTDEPEPEVLKEVVAKHEAETVQEREAEPEPEVEPEVETPKPTTSLFANLRKIKN